MHFSRAASNPLIVRSEAVRSVVVEVSRNVVSGSTWQFEEALTFYSDATRTLNSDSLRLVEILLPGTLGAESRRFPRTVWIEDRQECGSPNSFAAQVSFR